MSANMVDDVLFPSRRDRASGRRSAGGGGIRSVAAMGYDLTETENQERFAAAIDGDIFTGVDTEVHAPSLIAVCGQPGSWKSGLLIGRALQQLESTGTALRIVGDELRLYHPLYRQLMASDDRAMATHTALDANRWVEQALDKALERRCNVVLETTLRQPDVVAATLARFALAGYKVELWYLAVHPALSTIAIFQRYEAARAAQGAGRWTPLEHHNLCVQMAPVSMRAVANRVPDVQIDVWKRDGLRHLTAGQGELEEAIRVVQSEHDRSLTKEECDWYQSQIDEIQTAMLDRAATQEELASLRELRALPRRALEVSS